MAKWDASESWYTSCVGEKGHYYHQAIIFPNVLRLLGQFSSILDLGCGQGVLLRQLPKGTDYVGIDQSSSLIASAKKLSPSAHFFVADATSSLPIQKQDFDRVSFILSLQNMERGSGGIEVASSHLKKQGKLLLILNHPCFRIPRQTGWGIDEAMKLQYRRVNSYMSPQEIPIQTHPSKQQSETTYSYHHPLSEICRWLEKNKLVIETMEEWCSDKKSKGKMAKMEDRARREIPLFLAILALKGG